MATNVPLKRCTKSQQLGSHLPAKKVTTVHLPRGRKQASPQLGGSKSGWAQAPAAWHSLNQGHRGRQALALAAVREEPQSDTHQLAAPGGPRGQYHDDSPFASASFSKSSKFSKMTRHRFVLREAKVLLKTLIGGRSRNDLDIEVKTLKVSMGFGA